MNCQECDQIWNQLLDAESMTRSGVATDLEHAQPTLVEREQAARLHAQTCTRCHVASTRYDTLRQALRAWLSSPRPEITSKAALLDRILAQQATKPGGRASRRHLAWRVVVTTAAVACVLALVLTPFGWRLERISPTTDHAPSANAPGQSARNTSYPATDSRILTEALAEATEATLDLARTTSEPAARLGRQMLESATGNVNSTVAPDANAESTSSSQTGSDSLAAVLPTVPRVPGSTLLQQVGDGLSATVRPLSSTAHHAFGFLRLPVFEKNSTSTIQQPASKGA